MVLEIKYLEDIANIDYGTRVVKSKVKGNEYPVYGGGGETFRINKYNRENCVVISRFAMSPKCTRYVNEKIFLNDSGLTVSTKDNSKLLQEYLDWYILSKNDEIYSLGRGAGQRNLEIPSFKRMLISYPTNLEEQQKIISQLKLADEIRIKKRLANDKLDEFLKSTFISMFGNPETNDKHWGTGTIRDIVKEAKYGTSSKARSEGTYPILRMGNLTYEGAITLDDLKYIDLKDNELEKYLVKQGDILFNRTNSKELVGKTAVYRYEQPMAFAGYLVRVRTNEKANAEFLSAFMNSDYMKRILQLKCKNIVGMANINAQELQDFNIYIPPMELQNKFAKIVEKVETQKQKNELVIEQMNNLFNSLSQKAFKGEL